MHKSSVSRSPSFSQSKLHWDLVAHVYNEVSNWELQCHSLLHIWETCNWCGTCAHQPEGCVCSQQPFPWSEHQNPSWATVISIHYLSSHSPIHKFYTSALVSCSLWNKKDLWCIWYIIFSSFLHCVLAFENDCWLQECLVSTDCDNGSNIFLTCSFDPMLQFCTSAFHNTLCLLIGEQKLTFVHSVDVCIKDLLPICTLNNVWFHYHFESMIDNIGLRDDVTPMHTHYPYSHLLQV